MTLDKKNYMPAQPDNITLTHIYTPCLVIDNRKTTRLLINFRRGPNNQLVFVACGARGFRLDYHWLISYPFVLFDSIRLIITNTFNANKHSVVLHICFFEYNKI